MTAAIKKFALTASLAGLQVVWTIEMGQGTPYLISLGLSRPMLSLVWLAGPLSGLIMQPLIGAWSDRCKSRFGRRRPFIVAGTFVIVLCLFLVAYSSSIAKYYSYCLPDDQAVSSLAIFIAFLAFYGLDFGLNAAQASCRSLIVDCLPAEQQSSGNSWASAAIALGNIIGYYMGSLDMKMILPALGDTQVKVLATLASLILSITVAFTCAVIKEIPLDFADNDGDLSHPNSGQILRSLLNTLSNMPGKIQAVCFAQFFAWIGWFPFNFFSTEYIKDLWLIDRDGSVEDAVRAGSLALLLFSCVSILTVVLLPTLASWINGAFINSKPPIRLSRIWMSSHILFAFLMVSTIFVSEPFGAILIVAAVGMCWAVTTWVPFAIIGQVVASSDEVDYEELYSPILEGTDFLGGYGTVHSFSSVGDIERQMYRQRIPAKWRESSTMKRSRSADSYRKLKRNSTAGSSDLISIDGIQNEDNQSFMVDAHLTAGSLLGIHNFFIVLPQFLSTAMSSGIFELYSDRPAYEAIRWMWCFGGVCAIIAALIAHRIG